MTLKSLKNWRAVPPLIRISIPLILCVILLSFLVRAADTDEDGMSDEYEDTFSLNKTNAADASEDYDADTLINLEESVIWTDPRAQDTDEDGWGDNIDEFPLSRAVMDWGNTNYTDGDQYKYTGPDWFMGAFKEGGVWHSNAWLAVSNLPTGEGRLNIDLDRSCLSNDAILDVSLLDASDSELLIQLYNTNDAVIVSNLFGNVLGGTGVDILKSLSIPLTNYESAVGIRLQRHNGAVLIYKSIMYVDQDGDGLDKEQEEQLGTSDLNVDSDNDGLGDNDEVFIHETNPADADTDNDGLNDGEEVQTYSTDPTDADSDDDGMTDALEVFHGQSPTASNMYSTLPLHEGFEADTVGAGIIHGAHGWIVAPTDSASVQTTEVYEGQQALEIYKEFNGDDPVLVKNLFASDDSTVWLDFHVQVLHASAPTNLNGANVAFYFNRDIQLTVFDGNQNPGSEWITVTNHADFCIGDWIRIIVKMDYAAREWLICLNGYVVADGLGMASDDAVFSAYQIKAFEAVVDALVIQTVVPEGVSSDWDNLEDDWEMLYFGHLLYGDDDDPDGDNLTNLEEQSQGTDPNSADTDEDGIPDDWEIEHGLNALDDSDATLDPDQDGLTSLQEYQLGTHPGNGDSDGDGIPDGEEIGETNTDPVDADTDNDGMGDGTEYLNGYDPLVSNLYIRIDVDSGICEWKAAFEASEGYVLGPLNTQQMWQATKGANVTDSQSSEGIRSVIFNTPEGESPSVRSMKVDVGAEGRDVVWVSFSAKIPESIPNGLENEDVTALFYREDNRILAYDGALQEWITSQNEYPLNLDRFARIDLMLDYTEKYYAVCVDGILAVDLVNFASDSAVRFSRFETRNSPGAILQETFIDDISISCTEPAGLDFDNDGLSNYDEYAAGTDIRNPDTDGDGLLDSEDPEPLSNPDADNDGMDDAWEMSWFGRMDQNRLTDYDGDGLRDVYEFIIGTLPTQIDTDADGISDYEEYIGAGSDPLTPDFNYALTVIDEVPAYEYTNAVGEWFEQGYNLVAESPNGSLDYLIQIPTSGYYVVEVLGTQFHPEPANQSFYLEARLNGISLGSALLNTTFRTNSTARFFMPYLYAGQSMFQLEWKHPDIDDQRIELANIRILAVSGPDANTNGVQDWLEHRAEKYAAITVAPESSYVSPACIEGETHNIEWMSASVALDGTNEPAAVVDIKQALVGKWYGNVTLEPEQDTMFTLSCDSNLLTWSHTVTWEPLNIYTHNDETIRIRKDDALLLTMDPGTETNGEQQISISGITNYSLNLDQSVAHTFTEPGWYLLNATFTGTQSHDASMVVCVREGEFTNNPAVWIKQHRDLICPVLSKGTHVDTDPILSAEMRYDESLSAIVFNMFTEADPLSKMNMVVRTERNGAILDSCRVDGFTMYSAADLEIWMLEDYGDGSKLLEMKVVEWPVREQIDVQLYLSAASLSFEDGTSIKWYNADDFAPYGSMPVRFIFNTNETESTCHHLMGYQDSTYIGEH